MMIITTTARKITGNYEIEKKKEKRTDETRKEMRYKKGNNEARVEKQ